MRCVLRGELEITDLNRQYLEAGQEADKESEAKGRPGLPPLSFVPALRGFHERNPLLRNGPFEVTIQEVPRTGGKLVPARCAGLWKPMNAALPAGARPAARESMPGKADPPRIAYSTPTLRVYGDARDLTGHSGTAGGPDGSKGVKPRTA